MLPPDFLTISSSTMDWRQILIMMAWGQRKTEVGGQASMWNHLRFIQFPSYLLAGDGDPLEAVLAHQILKGQLQLHITPGRARRVTGAVGHGDLLQETERVMLRLFKSSTFILLTVQNNKLSSCLEILKARCVIFWNIKNKLHHQVAQRSPLLTLSWDCWTASQLRLPAHTNLNILFTFFFVCVSKEPSVQPEYKTKKYKIRFKMGTSLGRDPYTHIHCMYGIILCINNNHYNGRKLKLHSLYCEYTYILLLVHVWPIIYTGPLSRWSSGIFVLQTEGGGSCKKQNPIFYLAVPGLAPPHLNKSHSLRDQQGEQEKCSEFLMPQMGSKAA